MLECPPATVSPQIRGVLNKKPLAPHRWGCTNDQYTKCITLMGGVLTFLLLTLLGGLLQCNSITFCILYTVHYCTGVHYCTLSAIVLQVSFSQVSSRKIWKIRVDVSLVFSTTYDTKRKIFKNTTCACRFTLYNVSVGSERRSSVPKEF